MLLRLEEPLKRNQIGAIVLSPTRELALQTIDVAARLVRDTWIQTTLLVGGTDVHADAARCVEKGCNIVVATPGRLLDMLRRFKDKIPPGTLEVLVLDEADTLLDMGFADTITQILELLPKQRRTGLFSATQTSEVKALARAGMRNPAVVTVAVQLPPAGHAPVPAASSAAAGSSVPLTLTNRYMECADSSDKLDQLCAFLADHSARNEKMIVFVLTCAAVDLMAAVFARPAVRAAAGLPDDMALPILPLHGQMQAKKRVNNYARFVAAKGSAVLLCTDVAARGIDVPDVEWIVQMDAPRDPAFFIHRVGRTARAGRHGAALLMLLPRERAYVELLQAKRVTMDELPRYTAAPVGVGRALQDAAVADRDVLEKGTKAFMSFMRGYSEHKCKFIFKPEHLDVSSVALAYGLLKLPKLDELRSRRVVYEHARDVNTASIAFADASREEQRQARLRESAEAEASKRAARDERREKAIEAAAREAAGKLEHRKRTHKGVQKRIMEDWEMLAREERLEKRLRQGRISRAEYKREMGLLQREQGVDDEDADLQAQTALVVAADVLPEEDEDMDDGDDDHDEAPISAAPPTAAVPAAAATSKLERARAGAAPKKHSTVTLLPAGVKRSRADR